MLACWALKWLMGIRLFFFLTLAKFLCFLTPGWARAVHKEGMEGSRGVQSADSAPPGPNLGRGQCEHIPTRHSDGRNATHVSSPVPRCSGSNPALASAGMLRFN